MQAAGNAVLFEAESEMAVANHTWCLERRLTRWSLNQGTYDIIIGEKRQAAATIGLSHKRKQMAMRSDRHDGIIPVDVQGRET